MGFGIVEDIISEFPLLKGVTGGLSSVSLTLETAGEARSRSFETNLGVVISTQSRTSRGVEGSAGFSLEGDTMFNSSASESSGNCGRFML